MQKGEGYLFLPFVARGAVRGASGTKGTSRSAAPSRRRLRWAIGLASSALLCAGVAAFGWSGTAKADTSPGQGSSYAQSFQVTPHEGSLAVGAVFGEALAGHTNTFARAQSQGLDLGAVGESMRGYNCGSPPQQPIYDAVPEALQTETGAQGADQGQTQGPAKSDYFSNEFVLANGNPYGEADTSFAGPIADPSNGFVVSGLHTKSWSGQVNGVNVAGAASDIKSLDLGGGAVHLDGLHWAAVYPTGGQPTGLFTVGNAVIGGNAVPNPADLSALGSAINQALAAIGIQVNLPQGTVVQGIQFVTPLEIAWVPSPARDQLLTTGVNAAQPPYYQITNGLENGFSSSQPPFNALGQAETGPNGQQLAAALCQSDTPITVLDITVASFDGGGYFNTALGGVNATSSVLPANSYNLAALGFGSLNTPGSSQLLAGTAGLAGSAGSLGSLGSSGTPGSSPGGSGPGSGSGSNPTGSSSASALGPLQNVAASGPLLGSGLAGLGLLALLVEADRRKMRSAQRTITFEE